MTRLETLAYKTACNDMRNSDVNTTVLNPMYHSTSTQTQAQ